MKKIMLVAFLYCAMVACVLLVCPYRVLEKICIYTFAFFILIIPIIIYIQHSKQGKNLQKSIRGIFYCLFTKQKVSKKLSIAEGVKINHPECIMLGDQVCIDHDAEFYPVGGEYPSKIKIGNRVSIGAYNRFASKYEINIEDEVLFAAYVHITDHSHEFRNISKPVRDQGTFEKGRVSIGEGSWIGLRANILSGVSIGKHCVIAAGAVVTKSVPDYCVVAGCPAKVVKYYDFQKKEWVKA